MCPVERLIVKRLAHSIVGRLFIQFLSLPFVILNNALISGL
jgi:hypothetical protein